MGLSGFLYVAIVVGWAVYLVPFALKRYDEAARNRSVDRFSSAMRVLGRRETDVDDTLGDADEADRHQHRPVDGGRAARPVVADPGARRTAARVAARRRRRILLMLLVATAATGTCAALAIVPPWAAAIPGTLVVLWLLLCRRQARRDRAGRPTYPRQPRPDHAETPAEPVEANAEAEPVGHVQVPQVPGDDEPTVVLAREDLAEAEDFQAGTGSLWDPVPVTLPTYVSKPRAPRTIRTIDLGAAGVQSSGHAVAPPAQEAADGPAPESAQNSAPDSAAVSAEGSARGSAQEAGPARRAVGQ